jgi:3-hydroxyisobutyrate dehydrogenase-like beta-hydroxyacid dehydrogenase
MVTVGLISPGEMGHAIGAVLAHNGARVVTNLQGRGPRTVERAAKAGLVDLENDEALVREASVLLCVVAPALASAVAERVTGALDATHSNLLYVDCNAISPQTVRPLETLLTGVGSRFADVGIVGGPPPLDGPGPRLYASGPGAVELERLREFGLDIRVLGPESGQASGLKMCYGALTKGLTALATELLVAGRALGLDEPLATELQASQPELLGWIKHQMPSMPPKSARWVREMEEIAATFELLGLPPQFHQGAAALYQWIADTGIGSPRASGAPARRSTSEIVEELASRLE